MLQWIELIWKPIAINLPGMKLLLLDEATSHMTADVQRAFAALETDVEYIPGGCTASLQVLDVGINKPFKDRIRKNYEQFMIASTTIKPLREHVSQWIGNSWMDIQKEMIENIWKSIGFIDK